MAHVGDNSTVEIEDEIWSCADFPTLADWQFFKTSFADPEIEMCLNRLADTQDDTNRAVCMSHVADAAPLVQQAKAAPQQQPVQRAVCMLSSDLAENAGAPRRHKRGGKHTQQNKPQSLCMGMWAGGRELAEDDAISLGSVAMKAPRPHEAKLKSRAECIAAQHQHALCMSAVATNATTSTSPSHSAQWYDMTIADECVLQTLEDFLTSP